MICPICGGRTNTYRHPFSKIWCVDCGFVLREEGDRKNPLILYRCLISFPGHSMGIVVVGNSIHDFKDGFWVDVDFKLTNDSSCKYWIPPSSILYIEKEIGTTR